MKNIVLIGFMGTGKTTVGRRLANKLGYDFADTDEYVKKCEKMSVYDVCTKKGRRYFEGAQRFAVVNIAEKEKTVIATGGSCVWDEYNKKTLEKNGILIWLKANAETVYENTKNSPNKRQELSGLDYQEIKELISKSEKYYRDARYTVCVDNKDVDDVVSEIVKFLNDIK